MDQFSPEIINEFYRLYCEKQIWAPKEKRLDALTEVVRAWVSPDLPADQTTVFQGTGCEIQVGEKPIEKKWISMPAVYKAVGGWKAFQKLCTVTYKALAEVLGQSAATALQTEDRTGKRRLVAVQRAVVELPKAA